MSKADKNHAKLSLSLTTERSLNQYFSPSRGKVGPKHAPGVGLVLEDESSSLSCEGSSLTECIKASNMTSEAILCTNSTSCTEVKCVPCRRQAGLCHLHEHSRLLLKTF